jgi:hypothetical protein
MAKVINAENIVSSFSYLVNILRKRLILRNSFSTSFRRL